jgi:2-succinyl-5-enolpyruvyl-6-hydroxy-3-cyclohexene-1-carboxylate synthase
MPIHQSIVDLVEICFRKGIKDVILCPGSRSAALTINFVRSGHFNCYSISDERSAAFIALGMALETQKTVALVCTSGSAVYNFAPAIAEAYFQEIPLLILTADRPAEWIHQYDGQTIYQQNIYGKHVKKSYHLESNTVHDDEIWAFNRDVNEAINLAEAKPFGPIHINIGIKEPFYPNIDELLIPTKDLKIIENVKIQKSVLPHNLNFNKILILVGQSIKNDEFLDLLNEISQKYQIPIVGDHIANVHFIENGIHYQDAFIQNCDLEFQPDLLISFGKSIISKSLKQFLRKFKPSEHWHIQENENIIDPFQTITHKFQVDDFSFLTALSYLLKLRQKSDSQTSFFEKYHTINQKSKTAIEAHFAANTSFSDLFAIDAALKHCSENSIFCIGNSMSVRYSNLIPSVFDKKLEVFVNRGTSGIDGCLSTALGIALKTEKMVTLLIGDVSFMYDRNGLWNIYLPKNLRIIVLNNAGGNIFKMIDGPAKQAEANEYFVTEQRNSAYHSAIDANLEYYSAKTFEEIEKCTESFYQNSERTKLLEIFTEVEKNVEDWKAFKLAIG